MQYQIYHVVGTQRGGYDTFSDFVVVAQSENDARCTHPGGYFWVNDCWSETWDGGVTWQAAYNSTWNETPHTVECYHLGAAVEGTSCGVVCSSFHAG